MKNSTLIFLSILVSIFIISCNTEAKFGFRKKIKVDAQPTAKIITKPKTSKIETKIIDTTTEEIITSSIENEKIILPKTEQHHLNFSPSFSIKKIVGDSTNQNKKSVEPIAPKKINFIAILGLTLSLISFLGLFIYFTSHMVDKDILTILILGGVGFMVSIGGLTLNQKKYGGQTLSFIGIGLSAIQFGMDMIILSILLLGFSLK